MRFRPCIDIHNGKVKQIVGSTLKDEGDRAEENFVSEKSAAWFSDFYHEDGLKGGHIILLNPASSPYYTKSRDQAVRALEAHPGEFMLGGGVNPENAMDFLQAGASHVIVTSYLFTDGRLDREHLQGMQEAVGKNKLVMDLSCKKKDDRYLVVTDRWQKYTDVTVDVENLCALMDECDEFLIHASSVEGMRKGPDLQLISILQRAREEYGKAFPITYAGGIGTFQDIENINKEGKGEIDITVGSALDIFGGEMQYKKLIARLNAEI